MQKKYLKALLITGICALAISPLSAQIRVNVQQSDFIESKNLNVARQVAAFLEQQKVEKTISFFRFKSGLERKARAKQLQKLSKDIQPIKANTKLLVQTSYKNFKDSFNIVRIVYYNDQGRFCLFELFFLNKDISSKVVDVFIKDPIALEKKRKEISAFKKKNPNVSLPPESLPPGVYMKENN